MARQKIRDFGTCLSFNGTSDVVSRAIVSTQTNNFTYMAWFNIRTIGANGYVVYSGDNTANGFTLMVTSAGLIKGELAGIFPVDSATTAKRGIWYHVAMVRNAGTAQMYVNGSASGSGVGNAPLTPSGFTAVGGGLNGSGAGFASGFPGLIDDVRVYERALSADELLAYYHGTEPATTSIKLKWLFDEGSGSSATDSSGNSNTGTITGATYSTNVVNKPRTLIS